MFGSPAVRLLQVYVHPAQVSAVNVQDPPVQIVTSGPSETTGGGRIVMIVEAVSVRLSICLTKSRAVYVPPV